MFVPSSPIRILVAGGGTGGHLFPGIAIAEAFQRRSPCDIRFVGTRRGIEMRVVPENGFRLYTIPVSGLYRVGFIKKLKSLSKLPPALLKSIWILVSFRPHLVIGIGGYASGPVLALAVLFRKRVVIQEQNASPGMTNRILGRLVPLSFVPFKGADHLFRNPVVVGNPVRKAIINAAGEKDKRTAERLVISLFGGSQGAHILNQTMAEVLPYLNAAGLHFRIYHQTGNSDYSAVKEAYGKYPGLEAIVSPFFSEVASVLLESHVLICRAGSMINEIIAVGRASILVPITVSSGNHQLENARTMEAAGAALKIEESKLNGKVLFEAIQTLTQNPLRRLEMEKRAKSLFPGDSAEIIVDETIRHYRL